jgi:integrase
MPIQPASLLSTERDIAAVKPNGNVAEHRIKGFRNLVLRVLPSGLKTWTFIYKSPTTSKWRKIRLGAYPAVGLQLAKDLAIAHMVAITAGKDPLAAPATTMTFGQLADAYMVEHRRKCRPSWSREAQRMLDADIRPYLKDLRIDAISKADVVAIIERVARRGSFVSADNVLGLIRAIFNWAAGTGKTENDPTRGLKKRNAGRPRERVLTDDEIAVLWCALDQLPFSERTLSSQIRDALKLQLLLGVRVGEAVGAAKAEFDLARATWTIPAARTKSGREHRLPLSPLAAEVIAQAMRRSGPSPWLFPSPEDGKPIRPKSASRGLMRLRRRLALVGFGTHDLRRTVATRLGDLGVADDVIERVLNHAPATVSRRHYNRAERFGEMKAALEAWAKKVEFIARASELGMRVDQPGKERQEMIPG